jgi:Lrp/AsnC family transcriptional regulator, leucine-responsive regulatory protein
LDSAVVLDSIAWDILQCLQTDARISWSELGRRVGLSAPAVADRVRRMEDAGVIAGYHARVNLDAVGLPILAFVRLRSAGDTRCDELLQLALSLPEVLECHGITGEDAYIAKVAVRSVAHLEQVRATLMTCGQSTTAVVLSSPLPWRPVSSVEPQPRPSDRVQPVAAS